MKTTHSVLFVALLGCSGPLFAQEPPALNTASAVFQVGDVRQVTPKGPGRLEKTTGTFACDAERGQLTFHGDGARPLAIPFASITAVHYEESKYPKRSFWRSNYFIVIHYAKEDGAPATATMHFISRDDALAAVAAVRRDTGVALDRVPAPRSLLGIPAHAGIGASVVVTDASGGKLKGRISGLSPSAVEVVGRSGREWRFDQTNLRRIRWQYAPAHAAKVGFVSGAAFGVFATWLAAGLGGCYEEGAENCHVARYMAINAVTIGGVTAAVGTGIGAIRYPLNGGYDVYRAAPGLSERRSGLTVRPRVTASSTGVTVAVGF